MTSEINNNPHTWSNTLKKYFVPAMKCAAAAGVAYGVDPSGEFIFDLLQRQAILLTLLSAGYDVYQRIAFPSPYESLSPLFWETLERQNQKNEEAPLALYTLPTKDDNHAYSGSPSEAELLQMAEGRRLAIREAGKPESLKPIIHDVQEKIAPIRTMYIGAHGSPTFFDMGEKEYTCEEDHAAIFAELAAKEIKLMSCESGSFYDYDENKIVVDNIAETLSEKTNKKVWAPEISTDSEWSVIYPRGDENSGVLYYEDAKQTYRVFNPDRSWQYPEVTQKDKNAISLAWQKKVAYLRKAARTGDKRAFHFLILIYLRKDLPVYSPDKARRCFLKARKHGYDKNWNQLYAASQE